MNTIRIPTSKKYYVKEKFSFLQKFVRNPSVRKGDPLAHIYVSDERELVASDGRSLIILKHHGFEDLLEPRATYALEITASNIYLTREDAEYPDYQSAIKTFDSKPFLLVYGEESKKESSKMDPNILGIIQQTVVKNGGAATTREAFDKCFPKGLLNISVFVAGSEDPVKIYGSYCNMDYRCLVMPYIILTNNQ